MKESAFKDHELFTEERIERNYQEGLNTKLEGVAIADLTKRELIAVVNYIGKRYAEYEKGK